MKRGNEMTEVFGLKFLAKQYGLSYMDIAKKCMVSKGAVQKWMRNERVPNEMYVAILAEKFGVSEEYINKKLTLLEQERMRLAIISKQKTDAIRKVRYKVSVFDDPSNEIVHILCEDGSVENRLVTRDDEGSIKKYLVLDDKGNVIKKFMKNAEGKFQQVSFQQDLPKIFTKEKQEISDVYRAELAFFDESVIAVMQDMIETIQANEIETEFGLRETQQAEQVLKCLRGMLQIVKLPENNLELLQDVLDLLYEQQSGKEMIGFLPEQNIAHLEQFNKHITNLIKEHKGEDKNDEK